MEMRTLAGHSFLDEYKGLIGVLGVVIGSSYKERDAADARSRTRAFFAHHLTWPMTPSCESRDEERGRLRQATKQRSV